MKGRGRSDLPLPPIRQEYKLRLCEIPGCTNKHRAKDRCKTCYTREWVAKRRAEFFFGKYCVVCGSTDKLELDHIDPTTKVHHAIWSWSETRRAAELIKCQILCNEHHKLKTRDQVCKLRDLEVKYIRGLGELGHSGRSIAKEFNLHHRTVQDILVRKIWKTV